MRAVDRMSALQRVADVLSISIAELRGDEEPPRADERPEAFDTIRLALTGHPAIGTVLGTEVWELVHASRYAELASLLAAQDQAEVRELLGDVYQATATTMAKIGETDAA